MRAAQNRAERGANRPELRNQQHVQHNREHGHRHTQPHGCSRITSGPEGAAQHEKQHHAEDAKEHGAQERQRFGLHFGRGFHHVQQGRRGQVPHHRHDDRQPEGREKRLIDDAIHLLRLVGAGEARHEHAHPAEQRADEDDDDDDDLPADTNGGVRGVPDELPHHRVIDHALQSSDDVLDHRRPRQPPDGGAEWPFHERAIEVLNRFARRVRHAD